MKTIFTLLLFAVISMTVYSQISQNDQRTEQQTGGNKFTQNPVAYRLFPTTNMWTFIKLNTRNGQMWQIQYDVKGDNRHETTLSLEYLVTPLNEVNDRFTLYPTQNMYTFILLDQLEGKIWQVQWSIDAKNRFIIPIN
jgi:hypothetical protein